MSDLHSTQVRRLARSLAANFDANSILGVTPKLWLRSDTTINAGGFASQCTDKSGAGKHFLQATGSKQGALVAPGSDPNGYACVVADGTDDGYVCAAGLSAMTNPLIFFAARSIVAPASTGLLFAIGNTADAQSLQIQVGATTVRPGGRYNNAGTSVRNVDVAANDTFWGSSSIKIANIQHDSTAAVSATPTTRARLGEPQPLNSSSAAAVSTVASLAAGLFTNKTATTSFQGAGVYEVIVYDLLATTDQRRRVDLMLLGYYNQI